MKGGLPVQCFHDRLSDGITSEDHPLCKHPKEMAIFSIMDGVLAVFFSRVRLIVVHPYDTPHVVCHNSPVFRIDRTQVAGEFANRYFTTLINVCIYLHLDVFG